MFAVGDRVRIAHPKGCGCSAGVGEEYVVTKTRPRTMFTWHCDSCDEDYEIPRGTYLVYGTDDTGKKCRITSHRLIHATDRRVLLT